MTEPNITNTKRKIAKPIIVVGITLIVAYLIFKLPALMFANAMFEANKPVTEIVSLYSDSSNERLYLKHKEWGFGGNSEVYVVSTSPDSLFEPDPELEYVFNGDGPLMYRWRNDTLFLYTLREAKTPMQWNAPFAVQQVFPEPNEFWEMMRHPAEYDLQTLGWDSPSR